MQTEPTNKINKWVDRLGFSIKHQSRNQFFKFAVHLQVELLGIQIGVTKNLPGCDSTHPSTAISEIEKKSKHFAKKNSY